MTFLLYNFLNKRYLFPYLFDVIETHPCQTMFVIRLI